MATQINFDKEKLDIEQSFTLVYSGPSFEEGIKVDRLIENLKSIEELVYVITDVNSEYQSGYNKKDEIKHIKIIPRAGSIEEEILIMFSKPEVRDLVFNIFLNIFFYLLGKKDNKNDAKNTDKKLDKIEAKIEELIARDQSKNIKNLYVPLEKSEDKLSIMGDNKTELEIGYNQIEVLDNSIKKVEYDLKVEETTEELNGRISAINIDTNYLKFHVNGMEYAYQLYSDKPTAELLQVIAVEIRAKVKVRKIKNKIKNFYLIDYKNLQKKL
jgi:hypothetical protein